MNLEQMKKIVDGAPKWALSYCYQAQDYFAVVASDFECCVSIDDLRTELADREPMEICAVDIPHGTIVLEK